MILFSHQQPILKLICCVLFQLMLLCSINAQCLTGIITTTSGETNVFTCADDGEPDVIFFRTSSPASLTVYVVTDENNLIRGRMFGNNIDFDTTGVGVCRVYAVFFAGNFTLPIGEDITTATLGGFCHNISDNFVTINKIIPDGGNINLNTGESSTTICAGDGNPDILGFTSNVMAQQQQYVFVVTDESDIILAILNGSTGNFDDFPLGICRVWGIASANTLQLDLGMSLEEVLSMNDCVALSENFVDVFKTFPDGGMISTSEGLTNVPICIGDETSDELSFIHEGSSLGSYSFILTDINNSILEVVSEDAVIDFETASIGVCNLWGVSYTGNLIVEPGNNLLSAVISDDCYDLSTNRVQIVRQELIAGFVSLLDGSTTTDICVNDGQADVLIFLEENSSSPNYAFAITDEADNILQILSSFSFDFESAPGGICRVYGIAYAGTLNENLTGENIQTTALTDVCHQLSDNFITINRTLIDGGSINLPFGVTTTFVCPQSGNEDFLGFFTTSNSTESYVYFITNTEQVIVQVVNGNLLDVDDLPAGICYVYGLSYSGNFLANLGDSLANTTLASDCHQLSNNFITITKEEPIGGSIQSTAGETSVTFLLTDDVPDVLHLSKVGASSSPYQFIITDENNVVLGLSEADSIDFSGAGVGLCRVYGLAFTGIFNVMIGDSLDNLTALSSDCFSLSDSFIEVIRLEEGQTGERVEQRKSSGFQARLYPSVSNEEIQLELFLEKDQALKGKLEVFDYSGRLAYWYVWNDKEVIPFHLKLSVKDWKQGLYFLRIETELGFSNHSFMVVD